MISFPLYDSLPKKIKKEVRKRLEQLYGKDIVQNERGSTWRPNENFPIAILTTHTNQGMYIIDIWESPTGHNYYQLEKLKHQMQGN